MIKDLEYYMSLPYQLEIKEDPYEGGYVAGYPELRGCLTCAETIDEVKAMALDAKKCWLEACLEDGIEIPEPKATATA